MSLSKIISAIKDKTIIPCENCGKEMKYRRNKKYCNPNCRTNAYKKRTVIPLYALKYDLVSPKHYQTFSKETIDMMINIWGAEAVILHCEMTAFKYRMRIGNKPGQDIKVDLAKAKWYESKAIELKQKINQ